MIPFGLLLENMKKDSNNDKSGDITKQDVKEPELIKPTEGAQKKSVTVTMEHYSGQLPHPDILQRFEEIALAQQGK